MSSFWNFLFSGILIIIWVIAGGFITQASVYLTSYKDSDPGINTAYWLCFSAAFITWFLVGIFLILIFLSVIGVVALFGSGVGEEASAVEIEEAKMGIKTGANSISWLTIAFLVLALILVNTTGILAAIASNSLIKSPKYDATNTKMHTAYVDCLVAAGMALGAGLVIIIGMIVYIIIKKKKK